MTFTGEWAAGPGWHGMGLSMDLSPCSGQALGGGWGRWLGSGTLGSINFTPLFPHHRMLRPFITG